MRLTTRLLLEDETYRNWFRRPPTEPALAPGREGGDAWPWYVYVLGNQADPHWARKPFQNYAGAFGFVRRGLRSFHDMVIVSRRVWFDPPPDVTRPKKQGRAFYDWDFRRVWPEADPTYQWCGYCRRPTRFLYFRTHHAFPALTRLTPEGPVSRRDVMPDRRRCEVCGAGEERR